MIRVTVAQGTVREIPFTNKKGQPAKFYVQTAYAHTLDREGNTPPYPEKIEVGLDTDPLTGMPKPYTPGEYQLHPSAVYVDRNGRLAISPRLTPWKKPADPASR